MMKSSIQSSSQNVSKPTSSRPPISIDISMTQCIGQRTVNAKVDHSLKNKQTFYNKNELIGANNNNIRDVESNKNRKRTISSVRRFKPRNENKSPLVPHNSLDTPLSPNTPQSPMIVNDGHSQLWNLSDFEHVLNKKLGKYDSINTIRDKGYNPCQRFTTTLQGSMWRAENLQNEGNKVVIKVTKKALHDKHIALVDNMEVNVCEDILRETAILHYLTDHNPPKALTKFEAFFQDKVNYFLTMEDGGTDFFKFISKCHTFIDEGVISIVEWHRFCKKCLVQLTELIDWMHNVMHCAHLDISLENLLISDVMVIGSEHSNQITFSDDFQIKLCDFGLAEVFAVKKGVLDVDFECAKYVGKRPYKAPKVFGKKELFDARAADCWSLGVVVFMMIVGGQPWKAPFDKDRSFDAIVNNGKLLDVLHDWERLDYVTADIIDLLQKIFDKNEKQRLNIQKIRKHPFFRSTKC